MSGTQMYVLLCCIVVQHTIRPHRTATTDLYRRAAPCSAPSVIVPVTCRAHQSRLAAPAGLEALTSAPRGRVAACSHVPAPGRAAVLSRAKGSWRGPAALTEARLRLAVSGGFLCTVVHGGGDRDERTALSSIHRCQTDARPDQDDDPGRCVHTLDWAREDWTNQTGQASWCGLIRRAGVSKVLVFIVSFRVSCL